MENQRIAFRSTLHEPLQASVDRRLRGLSVLLVVGEHPDIGVSVAVAEQVLPHRRSIAMAGVHLEALLADVADAYEQRAATPRRTRVPQTEPRAQVHLPAATEDRHLPLPVPARTVDEPAHRPQELHAGALFVLLEGFQQSLSAAAFSGGAVWRAWAPRLRGAAHAQHEHRRWHDACCLRREALALLRGQAHTATDPGQITPQAVVEALLLVCCHGLALLLGAHQARRRPEHVERPLPQHGAHRLGPRLAGSREITPALL
mmetsp:Transcript_43012/g.118957  ORF Transcript_43012/g.118957 Transcript_43012/m.118957 type:complete len:260 (-) Transcript_43012:310-1089(-)